MTSIEQVTAAVEAARAALADAGSLSRARHEEIAVLLARSAELARVVGGLQLRVVEQVSARSTGPAEEALCRRLGQRSAKEAVANAFGIRAGEAQGLLALAAATTAGVGLSGAAIAARYPRVAVAVGEGAVSVAQARAIVGTLEPVAPRADPGLLAWAEGQLVDVAADPTAPLVPELLVTQARAYAAALDPDGVLPADERLRAMRSLRQRQRADGIWETILLSPPEEGSELNAFLDAYASPRVQVAFRDTGPDADTDSEPGAGADAGLEVVDDRTPEQRRHDVMMALVRQHAASASAPTAGGEPPTLVFHGDIAAYTAYLQGIEHPDRSLRIEHTGNLVPIETVERLLCSANAQHSIVDANGHVLALGRTQRFFSRAQHRALAIRDRGCRVRGCGMPVAWTEAHHILWWQHGGPTDIDNGILVCSYHHHEIHAGRLRVERAGEKPGSWRIVAELRPPDRSARVMRAPAAACATTIASNAAAPQYEPIIQPTVNDVAAAHPVRVPSGRSPGDVVPRVASTRPRRRVPSLIERSLRHRVPARDPRTRPLTACDHPPQTQIILRR
ncbi:DUF222 domain-containing protein [Agrococcus sp. Ld7]|uniref:HNH endonuclease signature motif containing protein n=1 Tax=Agrococcus sp. Ld7 TaxID=649148 RepID=UPI00386AEA8F